MESQIVTKALDVATTATPPVIVSSLTVFGVQLPDVVAILTIVYLVIHIGYIAYKWFRGI